MATVTGYNKYSTSRPRNMVIQIMKLEKCEMTSDSNSSFMNKFLSLKCKNGRL